MESISIELFCTENYVTGYSRSEAYWNCHLPRTWQTCFQKLFVLTQLFEVGKPPHGKDRGSERGVTGWGLTGGAFLRWGWGPGLELSPTRSLTSSSNRPGRCFEAVSGLVQRVWEVGSSQQ